MHRFAFALLAVAALPAWDRQKAFHYLEARQQEWAAWKPAQKPHGACVSCHTGLSYLIARRMAGVAPSPTERALVEGIQTRIAATPPQTMLANEGAEAILNLLTLSLQRPSRQAPLTPADQLALKGLWAKQFTTGDAQGSWSWFMHKLHPVESEHSHFFAATLASLALSAYPAKQSPANVNALYGYLQRQFAQQPLHNKLAWAAFSAKKNKAAKAEVISQLWAAQSPDGGFTSAALGPWAHQAAAPPDSGSNAYATAWAAFTAHQSGVSCSEPHLQRALGWLKQKQDPATGAWQAPSMNKVYPPGSMQIKFMTDAATGYAAAALIACQVN